LEALLKQLDQTIAERNKYMDIKEAKILELKHQLKTPQLSIEQQYEINKRLSGEYETYISDSAIFYVERNLQIAHELKNPYLIDEAKLKVAELFRIIGMYKESFDVMESLNFSTLDNTLKIIYYEKYKELYKNHSSHNLYEQRYIPLSDAYRDSLLLVLDKTSDHYKIVYAEKLKDENKLDEAKQILFNMLESMPKKGHKYAIITHSIANIYSIEKNTEKQNEYYAISAIADLSDALKNNLSLQFLAVSLFESGDLERAYKYITCSLEDAIFCNANIHAVEISKIYPIIDSSHRQKMLKQKKQLTLYLSLTAILSLILVLAVVYVYSQMKKLIRIRRKLSDMNLQLQEMNNQLQEYNKKLLETDHVKEEYIGHFLDLCSTYIDKLENYRKSLNKKASENKLDELFRMLKSKDMIEDELANLYQNFDNIFLHLYPSFVENFNALLLPEERFVLKQEELMNIEMRIFALIRLGITDSSKIAKFLRYSSQTIYNYRSRVKNKSIVPREDFEKMIMKIDFQNQ
jgi:hypothetical protein